MGRHVNFQDEQDRWLNKAEKLNRGKKKEIPLLDRDFSDLLTLKEQFEWIRLDKIRREKNKLYGTENKTTGRGDSKNNNK